MFFHEECRIYLTTLSGLVNILSRAAASASVAPCMLLMAKNHSLTHLGYLLLLYTTKLWVFCLHLALRPGLYIHTAPIDAFSVVRELMGQYGFVDLVRAVTLRGST